MFCAASRSTSAFAGAFGEAEAQDVRRPHARLGHADARVAQAVGDACRQHGEPRAIGRMPQAAIISMPMEAISSEMKWSRSPMSKRRASAT